MLGPILEGERVRLEPPRPEYLPAYQRWFADMDVTRYLLYRFPFTAKAEEEWLEQVGKDRTVIGEREEWGKGYAGEAMRLRTRYAFRELGLESVSTHVVIANEGSRRGLERAGYRQCGMRRHYYFIDGRWHDVWLGEVLRDEWEATQGETTR